MERKELTREANRKIQSLYRCVYTVANLPDELIDCAVGGHIGSGVWVTIPYDWDIYRRIRQALAEWGWSSCYVHESVEPGSRAITLKNGKRELVIIMSPKASNTCKLEVLEEKEVSKTERKYRVVCT